jgi:hypothetical protein
MLALTACVSLAFASATVRVMPNRDALKGTAIVVWGNTTLANGSTFDIDFGDATAHATGTVTDNTYIATTHTYNTAGNFIVTLTINGTDSETATVKVSDPALLSAFDLRNIKINMAIEDGLRFLYFNQVNRSSTPTTQWHDSGGGLGYGISYTSLAVLAFENHGHVATNDPNKDIYQDVVQRGLNFIFDRLSIVTLTSEPAGDPRVGVPNDADLSKGLGSTSFPAGYSTSVAALAVAGANAPTRTVAAGLGVNNSNFVVGKTYAEILQRQINTVVWGAADSGATTEGGFRYGLDDNQSDGSAIGWAVLAMLDATAAGATVPAFAATELAKVIAATTCTPANGDQSLAYTTCGQGNFLRTGVLLQALKFMNVAANDSRVTKATSYLSNAWNVFHPNGESFSCSTPIPVGTTTGSANNKGCAYAMFQAFKGLKLYGIQTLPGVGRAAGPGAIVANDWYEDYRDYLIQNQQNPNTTSGGQWAPNQMFWSCCDTNTDGITALAELILSPVALIAPTTLTLAPLTDTNPVGGQHTVTATALNNGQPVAGATITFTVTAGPNQGTTGQAVTDANGNASFIYTDSGGAGTDTIVASIGALTSNEVTKTWQNEPTSVPTLSEWAQILMMTLLALVGLWALRRRGGPISPA